MLRNLFELLGKARLPGVVGVLVVLLLQSRLGGEVRNARGSASRSLATGVDDQRRDRAHDRKLRPGVAGADRAPEQGENQKHLAHDGYIGRSVPPVDGRRRPALQYLDGFMPQALLHRVC